MKPPTPTKPSKQQMKTMNRKIKHKKELLTNIINAIYLYENYLKEIYLEPNFYLFESYEKKEIKNIINNIKKEINYLYDYYNKINF